VVANEKDEFDFDDATVCTECAKHPSLREYITKHGLNGAPCGICREQAASLTCDPNVKEGLINLIKALVRFFYDEYAYNRHFGGDEIADLLTIENPIFEHESKDDRQRFPERGLDFISGLFSTPYRDPKKGIAIYAGHSDGVRLAHHAIKDSLSPTLRQFGARLSSENYFDVEPDVEALITQVSPRVTKVIRSGTRFFRARIGVQARYIVTDGGWKFPTIRQPYRGLTLGAPKPGEAGVGRLNRAGVAFLYLASDADTAVAEVRPHPGHFISLGEFEATKDLEIASLEVDIAEFCQNESELDLFYFLHSTDKLMALPVVPEQTSRYSITQLVANCLRRAGFAGVSYQSSIGHGLNLCIFEPSNFEQVGDPRVMEVKSLVYKAPEVASTQKPKPGMIERK
jgi:hypothetical protein